MSSQNFVQAQSAWLTSKEAAAYLKIRPRTLLYLCREGRLKGYRLSGSKRTTWRFRREDLDSSIIRIA